MVKVISWCFYFDKKNKDRLAEYLLGLKCNQRAARYWFPGWQLRLYYDQTMKPAIKEYIEEICKHGYPNIEMIPTREGYNPMVERYRPFFDPEVEVCAARDIDSILSKTDANYIQDWLNNNDSDILSYKEHMQHDHTCMGGGITVKTRVFKKIGEIFFATPDKKFARGIDERQLIEFLKYGKRKNIITRMTAEGIYTVKDNNELPEKSKLLWNIPFFDSSHGYIFNYPNLDWLMDASVSEIVEFVRTMKIRREHIFPDLIQHSEKILKNKKWVR